MTDSWQWPAPWWQGAVIPLAIGCHCGGKGDGWALADDDRDVWVHTGCEQPSVAGILEDDMLNYFQHGPHHNELVETRDLLGQGAGQYNWIADYRWTQDKITGSVSGREARVWVHKDHQSPSTGSSTHATTASTT